MSKILWLDLETTDSTPHRGGGVHQIAWILEIDGQIICKREYKVSPLKGSLINAESLKVCGVDIDIVMAYPSPVEAFKQLVNDIHPHRKVVIGGFNNAPFDNPYFFNWWWGCAKELKKYSLLWVDYVYSDALDVRCIALYKLLGKRGEIPSFKLGELAKYLGIEVTDTNLHDALYDVELTRLIYHHLNQK
jgi:DNA polymerase-3 subunit epsilon